MKTAAFAGRKARAITCHFYSMLTIEHILYQLFLVVFSFKVRYIFQYRAYPVSAICCRFQFQSPLHFPESSVGVLESDIQRLLQPCQLNF